MLTPNHIHQPLQAHGLTLLGHGMPTAEVKNLYPWANTLLLIGVAGDSSHDCNKHKHSQATQFWHVFSTSSEYQDQQPNAMDRWSVRIGTALAQQWQGVCLLPFEGPPYWPFLAWAHAFGSSVPSPLGMYLHKDYGLWHSYRFAIVALWQQDDVNTYTTDDNADSAPCLTCHTPCINACPVDAFNHSTTYAIAPCRNYVRQCFEQPHTIAPQKNCAQQGCLARHACPQNRGSYTTQQRQYHMQVFAR